MPKVPPMPPPKQEYEEYLVPIELPTEVAERAEAAIAQADQEAEEARVNFRWGVEQVAIVKRAAEVAGVPYQTYLKQVVFRQAIADLKDAAALGLVKPPSR